MYTYLFAISVLSYLLMCVDKIKSIYTWWRIPEYVLFLLAICGGCGGIYLGMCWPMYHKAGKEKWRLYIPIICGIWIGVVCVWEYIQEL